MNTGGINKVFLIGWVSSAPRKHYDHWRLVLTTPERFKQSGTEVAHEESHVIHLPLTLTKIVPEAGQWLFIEGKTHTTMHRDEQGNKHYRTAVNALRLTFLRPDTNLQGPAA